MFKELSKKELQSVKGGNDPDEEQVQKDLEAGVITSSKPPLPPPP